MRVYYILAVGHSGDTSNGKKKTFLVLSENGGKGKETKPSTVKIVTS
jgi:hypothetical protein